MQDENKQVRVSILLPLYNGVEFLPETLPSIFNQTFNDFSLWIGINGHTFGEEQFIFKQITELVTSLRQSNNSRIHICAISNQVKGAAAAINYLTDLSGVTDRNHFVANIDADDLWEPNKLEEQFKVIDQYVNVCPIDIIGTKCIYFGDSTIEPPIPSEWISKDQLLSGNNPFIHSSVISRRGIIKYNKNEFTYDYDCWLKTYLIDQHTNFYNVPLVLVKHRIHKQSFYNTTGKQDPKLLVEKYTTILGEYQMLLDLIASNHS